MKNFEISKILREIAAFLEMDNIKFKPRAYEKAASSIEATEEDLIGIHNRKGMKGLLEIPGVGQSIAEKIEELIKTGRCEYHEQLKEKIPVDIESLTSIEGVGPKTIKELYKKLKIKTVEELEKAARAGEIRKLPNFGEKSEESILKGIDFFKKSKGRFILGEVLPPIREIKKRLENLKEVKRVEVAGSVRRWRETIGDVDFLIISDEPEKVMNFFVSMPDVMHVYGKGNTRSSVKLKTAMDADLRVVSKNCFGAALQYFTGSKDHNIELRRIAMEKGWKLSEYGIFGKEKQIAGETEKEVYNKLGLQWIPPEIRENAGEIEAAKIGKLPELIDYDELKGDLQIHTNWSDGINSIEEMAKESKKIGLEYIVISDHTKALAMTGGLDEKMLLKQMQEIDNTDRSISGITILKGCEANIQKDGNLDVSNSILSKMDIVGAGIHSNFNLTGKEQTQRIVKTMENENVDLIVHPTCRQIHKREAIELDIEKIIETAKRTDTILEIDAFPDRLDLKDDYVRKCVEANVRIAIDSDAHSKLHLYHLEFGIATARRGWATNKDVVNTRSVKELLKCAK